MKKLPDLEEIKAALDDKEKIIFVTNFLHKIHKDAKYDSNKAFENLYNHIDHLTEIVKISLESSLPFIVKKLENQNEYNSSTLLRPKFLEETFQMIIKNEKYKKFGL